MSPQADGPEQRAREQIDAALDASGWVFQDFSEINLSVAPGAVVGCFAMKALSPRSPLVAVSVFRTCVDAIRSDTLITRESKKDKEFHFQNWFRDRLAVRVQGVHAASARA